MSDHDQREVGRESSRWTRCFEAPPRPNQRLVLGDTTEFVIGSSGKRGIGGGREYEVLEI